MKSVSEPLVPTWCRGTDPAGFYAWI